MHIRKVLFLLLSITVALHVSGQNRDYSAYPFVQPQLDTLQYDSVALKSFFIKLKELKEGKRKNLIIMHVGDSHLQADFFSGWVREQLQRDYGNGGRGLIFPYRIAASNEPLNFRSLSWGNWISRRCVKPFPELPIGICGFTLRTYDSIAGFQITVKNADSLNYAFNKVYLFHDKGPECFNWVVSDSSAENPITIHSKSSAESVVEDSVTLRSPMNSFNMQVLKKDSAQNEATLYGLVLTNNQPGIIYNTIGANGAMYINYIAAEYFTQQLKALKPDLIIISLGTNEAYSRGFSESDFQANVQDMITNVRLVAKDADILLTTPPDGYRFHRYKNLSIPIAVSTLQKVAEQNHAAFWDFYHTMGGYGSMYKWYAKRLAQRDLLHFNSYGYTLQAELFYDALSKAIKNGLGQVTP